MLLVDSHELHIVVAGLGVQLPFAAHTAAISPAGTSPGSHLNTI